MATEAPLPAAPLPALRIPRWTGTLLALAFFVCLGGGFALTFFGPGGRRTISHLEKRTLAPKPGWPHDLASLATFPKRCGAWVDDHLYDRERMMGINSFLQVKLLRQSPLTDVIIGRQGWLYYNIGTNINDYRGLERFTPQQLAFMRAVLTVRRDWFRRHHVPYLFVVAPDKHSIYPDFLPDHYRRKVRGGTLLDQFLAEMARRDGGGADPVEILDLRPALRTAREKEQLYMRTDTHWNEAGARVGAQAIHDWMQSQHPGVPLPPAVGGPPSMLDEPGGDLAVELGLARTMRETIPHWPVSPEVKQAAYRVPGMEAWEPLADLYERNDGATDLRAVFLHDSYTQFMKPSLSAACQSSLYLARPSGMHYASHALTSRLVETFQPHIVVEEVVERNLTFFFFGDPAMKTELARYAEDQ